MEMKDYSNGVHPTWCPGCGDFSVLRSIQLAAAHLGIPREKMAVISGIGCSGRLSGYMSTYGFHSVHGRSLPVAQSVKLSNKELTVVAAGGDGDAFAIGMSHTLHAIRRNVNITYLVMNNQVYGLTKGHTSPVSEIGLTTKSAPGGSKDEPIHPGLLALSAGVTFYAHGFSAEQEELVELIKAGIEHKGFSFINIFSPCVTYNKTNTYDWFRKHLVTCEKAGHHDLEDLTSAWKTLKATQGLVRGIIYQKSDVPTFEENHHLTNNTPMIELPLEPTKEQFNRWTERFRLDT